jgi:hypothetical protein
VCGRPEKGTRLGDREHHAVAMIFVTALAAADVALRPVCTPRTHPTVAILALSLVVAGRGRRAVRWQPRTRHGFTGETAGDSPVACVEPILMPGDPEPTVDDMSPAERLAESEVAVTSHTPDPLHETP